MCQTRFSIASVVLLVCLIAEPGRPGEPCLRDAPPYDGHPLFGNPQMRASLVYEPSQQYVATCMAIADYDGDGDLDAAVSNQDFGTRTTPAHLTVLLNLGDGVFADPVPYDVGDHPPCVAGGDLDGDRDIDLAVVNADSNRVSVLLNNGDGTLAPRAAYDVGVFPRSVAIGDLDGDADADLVTMNAAENTISVLRNNGNGVFSDRATHPAGSVSDPPPVPWRFGGPFLAMGDLDGDNDLDVVVPASGFISVMMNNGDGTFAPLVSYPVPYASGSSPVWSVTIGDWDRDGDPDLATVTMSLYPDTDDLSIFMNSGDGTFAAPVSYNMHYEPDPGSLQMNSTAAAGDVDGDGYLDLAVSSFIRNKVVLLTNNGDGTFAPFVYYDAGGEQQSVALADLSGDGHPDLAVLAGSSIYGLAVLFNRGDGTFITHDSYPERFLSQHAGEWNGVEHIVTADLDRDGDMDLALSLRATVQPTGRVFVMLNDGAGSFAETGPYRFGDSLGYMVLADLDGDGNGELIVADWGPSTNYDPGGIWVLVGRGDGTFQEPVGYNLPAKCHGLAVGDLDGDSWPDVIVADGTPFTGRNVLVLLNNQDGSLGSAVPYDAGAVSVRGLALGDLDGDQDLDVACASPGSDVVSVLFNNGDGTLGPAVVYLGVPGQYIVTGPWLVAMVDLDDDEDLDLAVANRVYYPDPGMSFFFNQGDGSFGSRVDYFVTGDSALDALVIGGIRGLGGREFAVGGQSVDASVFFQNLDGTFSRSVAYGTSPTPQGIVLGDFDLDGDVDLATSNSAGNYSLLWHRACRVLPGDFDGDGDVDLADFVTFQLCFGGSSNPPAATCPPGIDADLDGDGDVDLADFLIFQQNFTGSL